MAVYTDVSEEDLDRFLQDYEIGRPLALKGVAEGVENSNFSLHTEKGYFFLTLYEKRTDERDLPFFLALLDHLRVRGVPCPQPIHNKHGAALGRMNGRAAAIVTHLDGMWPRKPNLNHCAKIGAALAQLHHCGGDFPLHRPNRLTLADWAPLFETTKPRADEVREGLSSFIANELVVLTQKWPQNLPHGIIHADLFPDNALFLGGEISGLIDFYFSCNDFYAYDLALTMNAWCFEADGAFNVTKGGALINAYRDARQKYGAPMTANEREALPVLARGAALRILLTRLFDWLQRAPGALVKPKDPLEYLRILRFHQRVANVQDYGASS